MKRRNESGFAMLFVFVMAAAIAIGLYVEIPRVAFEYQRQKEQLLIDRGGQYQRAIQLFYRKYRTYPQNLDDLETTRNIRFLRRRYKDPMTGKDEWRLIHVGPGGVLTDSLVQTNNPLGDKSKGTTADNSSGPDPGGVNMAGPRPGDRISGRGPEQPIGATPDPYAPQYPQPQYPPQPGQPGQPAQPGQPGQPQDPSQLGQPGQPPDPSQPGQPGQPQIPGQPPQPGQPAQPQYPGQPGQPQYPGQPGQPQYPGQPGQPAYPGQPQYPGQPGQPAYPGQPQYPGQPGQPAYPGQPQYPGQPGQPAYPGQPQYPNQPGQPAYPGQPQYPGQPGQPAYPGQPQYPGQPAQPPYPGQPNPYGGVPPQYPPGRPNTPGQQYPYPTVPGQPQGGNPGQPNQAIGVIQNLLTTPRQAPSTLGGFSGGGAGLAGVASTAKGEGIHLINDRSKYQEWEFIYDLKNDKTQVGQTQCPPGMVRTAAGCAPSPNPPPGGPPNPPRPPRPR